MGMRQQGKNSTFWGGMEFTQSDQSDQIVSRFSFLRDTAFSGSLLKASSSAASNPFDRRGCLCFKPNTEIK